MSDGIVELDVAGYHERIASLREQLRTRAAVGTAQVYVHMGQWVIDCPYPACGNAMRVNGPEETTLCCDNCRYVFGAEWPTDAALIKEVLDMRPVPGTRYWAPAGHRQAIACGFPDGQSVDDLLTENEENL